MEINAIENATNLMAMSIIHNSNKSNVMKFNMNEFMEDMQLVTLKYLAAIKEVENRIDIINEDFRVQTGSSPIEHVTSRVKSPKSIVNKMIRRNIKTFDLKSMEENIFDIAGVRISCSFMDDIYKIADILSKFDDFEIVTIKDYVEKAKPSGYRSYHMIVKVPVHLTTGVEKVNVEIQIRTMAMDFWASLEHKIKYKYDGIVPESVEQELYDCSMMALKMDMQMQALKKEVLDANEKNIS